MFPWYVVPPVPSFYLIIVGFFNFLKQKKIKTFFLVILFSVLFYFNIESLLKKSFLEIKNGFFTYEKARYRIAEIINKITPEKTTLQTGTIGQFGYFTNAYIDDLMHLVTPFGQRVKNPDLIIPQDWKWAGRNAGLGVPGYSIIGKILIQPAEEQYYYIYKRLPSQKEPDKKNKRNLQLKFIDPDYYILEEKLSPKNNQMVTIDDKIVFKNFLLREIKSNLLCREYEIFSKYQILKEGTKDFNIELVFSSQIFPNLTYRESYSLFSPKGIKLQPSKNYLQKYVIIVPRFFWFKEFLPIFIFDPDVMLCLQNEKGQKTPVYLKHHAGNFWEFGQNN
jgi:hypothetical protein